MFFYMDYEVVPNRETEKKNACDAAAGSRSRRCIEDYCLLDSQKQVSEYF